MFQAPGQDPDRGVLNLGLGGWRLGVGVSERVVEARRLAFDVVRSTSPSCDPIHPDGLHAAQTAQRCKVRRGGRRGEARHNEAR
jgi:hypothetical protein